MPARDMAGDRGQEVPRKWAFGFAGGGLRQRQNCEPNLRLLVEMVGFLVSITFFHPKKSICKQKGQGLLTSPKWTIHSKLWAEKKLSKENLCWNYPSKEGPQETNMEPKKLVVLGRCFGAFSGEPSVSFTGCAYIGR